MKKEFSLELEFEAGQRVYQYTLVKNDFDILSRKIEHVRIQISEAEMIVRYVVDGRTCPTDTVYESMKDAQEAAIAELTAKRLRDDDDDDELDEDDEDDEDDDVVSDNLINPAKKRTIKQWHSIQAKKGKVTKKYKRRKS